MAAEPVETVATVQAPEPVVALKSVVAKVAKNFGNATRPKLLASFATESAPRIHVSEVKAPEPIETVVAPAAAEPALAAVVPKPQEETPAPPVAEPPVAEPPVVEPPVEEPLVADLQIVPPIQPAPEKTPQPALASTGKAKAEQYLTTLAQLPKTLLPETLALPALAAAHPAAVCAAPTKKLGTTIDWVGTPEKAAPLAAEQKKLLFVIQVSGNFAREEFT